MFNQDLINLMHDERERQIEADLRVRRLLGPRGPIIRWRQRKRPHPGGARESRGR